MIKLITENLILNEELVAQFPDAEVIIVRGVNCLLAIRRSFLQRFVPGDRVVVLGERLSSTWGHHGFRQELKDRSVLFKASSYSAECYDYQFVDFDKEREPEVLEQIQAAREYRRRVCYEIVVVE